jgi:alpha-1,2-mannosyltransferase
MGTAFGATMVAGALFPDQSREFWTTALWDTSRVGVLSVISNQSERGMLARLHIGALESKVWAVAVLVTLAFWAWRVRRAPGDVMGGFALTGVLGCLISPVTWIHHCVWLMPALVRCIDAGLSRADRRPLYLAGAAYLLMTSRITWLWERPPRPPLEIVGSNIYLYFSLALLAWTPVGAPAPEPARQPEEPDLAIEQPEPAAPL